YHVAVFPSQYASYVARITNGSVKLASASAPAARTAAAEAADAAAGDNGEDSAAQDARDAALLETADLTPSGPAGGDDAAEYGAPQDDAPTTTPTLRYRVARGETLWSIARRHDVTVDDIKNANGLTASRIDPGQI